MKKQKIIEMVERHTSVDSARKELVNLKTLLNSTECKISQYQLELNSLERFIEEDEKKLEQKKRNTYKEAEENVELIRVERQQRKSDLKKRLEREKEHLDQLVKVNTLDKKNLERSLEETNNSSERNTKEYNELIEMLQNKMNIFNRKQKEKEIEKANEESKAEEERLTKHANYLNDRILETNKEIEALEKKKIEVASEYAGKITAIEEAQRDSEDNFNKQQNIFNQINSDTNLSELSYFNQYSLKDIVTLIVKISNTKVKKQETEALLEQSKMEKEDIVNKIESLNNEIDTVLKEREQLKEKITTTKENLGKQAMNTINTVKSAVDTVLNYEVSEEEKTEDPLQEFFSSVADNIKKKYKHGKVKKYGNSSSNAVGEEEDTSFEPYDENVDLDELAKKIIEKEKKKSNDQESLDDLINKIINGGSDNSGEPKQDDSDEPKENNSASVGDVLNQFLGTEDVKETASKLIKNFLRKRK